MKFDIEKIRETAEKVYLECCRQTFTSNWIGGGQSISYREPDKNTHRWTYADGGAYAAAAGVSRAIANKHLRMLADAGGWEEEKRDCSNYGLRFYPSFAYHQQVGAKVIGEMVETGMEFASVTIARSCKAQESRKGFVIRKWLRADGDRMPADASGPVDVEFRDGDVASYPDGESLGGWVHEGQHTDVMLWRPRPDRRPAAAGAPA